jgi:hypothetical protein
VSDNWVLFWAFVGCALLFALMLAAAGGFVYFYLWALGKLLIVVVQALTSATVSVVHSFR